ERQAEGLIRFANKTDLSDIIRFRLRRQLEKSEVNSAGPLGNLPMNLDSLDSGADFDTGGLGKYLVTTVTFQIVCFGHIYSPHSLTRHLSTYSRNHSRLYYISCIKNRIIQPLHALKTGL